MNSIIHILHIDDEINKLEFVKEFLEQENPNFKLYSVISPKKALLMLKNKEFDCIVTDYQMPEMNGVEFGKKVKAETNIPVIIYTGSGSEEVAEQAFAANIDDYVRKESEPSHLTVLAKRINAAVEKNKMELILKKSEANKIEISFNDTGVGISKKNLTNLFTSYYTTKKNGIGLGLVNMKKIIETHKGSIKIESKGTTIILNLPLE